MNDGLAELEGATPIEIAERSAGNLLRVSPDRTARRGRGRCLLGIDRARFIGLARCDALGRRACLGRRRVAVDNGYVARDTATTAALLSTYGWHPSADLAFEEIELTARDFKRADLLDRRTDPEDLDGRWLTMCGFEQCV